MLIMPRLLFNSASGTNNDGTLSVLPGDTIGVTARGTCESGTEEAVDSETVNAIATTGEILLTNNNSTWASVASFIPDTD